MGDRLDQLRAKEARLERDRVLADYIDSTQRRDQEKAAIEASLKVVRAEIQQETETHD